MFSASIALQPIATDLSHATPRPRVEMGATATIRPELGLGQPHPQQAAPQGRAIKQGAAPEADAPETPAPPAVPAEEPLPRGAMFAAAIIAGQLSPKPESMEEVALRAGIGWTPPDSDFRLTDLTI